MLLKNTSSFIHCHLSKRFRSYSVNSKEIEMTFEDGTTATCDLLIGADGLKSVVRKQFIKENVSLVQATSDPIWSGSFAYRSMIPSHLVASDMPEHRALKIPTIVSNVHFSFPSVNRLQGQYCGKNQVS